MQDLLIKNGKVMLFENNDVVIKPKEILIQNGKIVKIEDKIKQTKSNKNESSIKSIDAKGCIVMPGLINTHGHIPMSIFRATTEDVSLYEWLHEKIWPVEDRLTKQDIYNASMLSFLEMISTGTTCINDQYFMPEEIRKVAEKCKIRAVLTRPLMDTSGNLDERVEEFINFYETRNKKDDLITYSVAPHGLYTCSERALKVSSELAKKYNLPIHTHFLESKDEVEDIIKLHGEKAINVLKKYFDGIHLILAHCVKLTDTDIEVLKTMDCAIVHNPVSNLMLGCKIADTTKYVKKGLNVALRNRWPRFWKQLRYV